jgi:hypothetical protein
MARGKYLTSANADDRHSPDAFERLAGALESDPEAAVSYGDYAETNVPNDTLGPGHAGVAVPGIDFRRDRLLVKCFVGAQPMWRRSLHAEFGFFREDLRIAADWDFWNRVARRYRFTRVPRLTGLVYFSAASTNLSLADPGILRRESEEVADLHLRYYWADLNPRVTVVWIQDGGREEWRRSFGSIARQSVRPDRIRIVGETPETALDVWKEFPGAPFGVETFRLEADDPRSTWNRVLSHAGGGYVAYLKGTDLWDKDHLRDLADWMGETNFRFSWVAGENAARSPGISATAHHVDVLPAARGLLHGRGIFPGDAGWFDEMSGRVAGSAAPRDAYYPLRGEVSWQARERLRDAAGHFFRKGMAGPPRRIDVTARPLFAFLKEFARSVARREGGPFERAVWRGVNNWLRYSLREEAHRGGSGKPGGK